MKLISFAVVSLLAITVSAYPQQTTTTQDVQSSQSTSTQTSQPSQSTSTNDVQSSQSTAAQTPQPIDQDKVQAEVGRLTKIYEEKDARFRPVDEDLKAKQQEFMNLEEKIRLSGIELQDASLSSEDRESMEKMGEVLKLMLKKVEIEYKRHYKKYGQVREDRDDAKAELQLFEENQKLMEEHNANNGIKVGPSPRSLYNMKILEQQNTRFLKRLRNYSKN
ncbi:hypothetical protein BASA50_007583 [Batrachochytrium salamandrivorans]|uniref:Uncharacterized protein n=1 Tax=Batrachochytrium salamandrivorans TaxID=1357716 RepID=A0ABQ8F6M5_9FUNG|nr:hypothetical protein BASA50_007583 [Batrachochytrium salamandrivorans]